MAKGKMAAPTLQSWEEVDRCLREIGECEIAVSTIQADMNIAINDVKERAVNLSDPLNDKIKRLTALVKEYAEHTKADMNGKSKLLNFGKVGFRQSSSVIVTPKMVDLVINNLKQFGMQDCISTKETINKEILEKYSDTDIAKVGASRKIKDNFFLETDKEKIRR